MKDPQITAHSESELVVRTRPTKPGKQAGTLFLYDSRGQSYQLQVSVEGIPAITVKPEVLQFGAVVQGSTPEKPLIIQFSEPRTYFVERLHFDTNLFDIEQLANSDERPNGTLRFRVRVKKSAAIGEFRETLAVYLRKEQEATACVVSLTGRVTPELYATPPSLRVKLTSNNTAIQRSIILRSATGQDFKVTSLLAGTSAITANLRLQRTGVAIIDVSIAIDDAANLPQSATLSIETNVSSHPEVIVPIEFHQ